LRLTVPRFKQFVVAVVVLLGMGLVAAPAPAVAGGIAAVAGVLDGEAAMVAGVLAALLALLSIQAGDAEHDRKCLALQVYVQDRYWGFDPPGPNVVLTSVYKTGYHCAGSYSRG
jgi:hypothetical protein